MAGSTENGKPSTLPMKEERRPLLKDVNHFLTCLLCDGYFFNATTIVECAHTYCRACIIKFLETEKYCPACEAQGHRTKPNPCLRYDAIIQRLVYKTVPGLYQNELDRRNSHLLKKTEESKKDAANADDRLDENYYFSPDEPISISLEYIDNKIDGHHNNAPKPSEKINNLEKEQVKHKRYLQCPAKLTIRHIYKFIKLKYNLQQNQEVEVLYDKTKLPGSFSLMDVAYTFSWKRDTPMRLRYQILESITIQVPQTVTDKMSNKSVPVKNNFVTNVTSPNNMSNGVQSTNGVSFEKTTKSENLSTKVNLKRKFEADETCSKSNDSSTNDTKENPLKNEGIKDEAEPAGRGLSVKVPRISTTTFKDMMDFKKDGHDDKPKPTATVSPCTENGLKLQLKSTTSTDNFNDDYMKYEQDIEEVEDDDDDNDDDDDDDDDNDRLRISALSEEDTRDDKPEENCDQNLVVETLDADIAKEDHKDQELNGDVSRKSTKYKRKSKKSKHSHHHKHHRHHDRKNKTTPQATILHSPDTDIMKLKFKLNNVKPDIKYHKQKRKRKKSSEYFSSSFSSSSSVCSTSGGMSPDAHNPSRADEDSLHSHTSEISAESMDTSSSKDETPSKPTTPTSEPIDKYQSTTQSTTSKEKLLQMRAFRPRNVAVVKPEENHKLDKSTEKPPKNDNNNNESISLIEAKEKPKPAPAVLRPPSSITVSKITAAEKQKMEQEKLLMMNGNNDDKPSLEIMLVNGPPSSTKSFVSPPAVSSTSDALTKPKTPPRPTRPPPAAIPIVQYQKMKSNEQTTTIPKSLTITPQIQRSKSTNETLKKAKDALLIREGAKRSMTVALSGNPFHNDYNGALDLSSGIKSTKYPDVINLPQTLLNKKICMNGICPVQNGTARPTLNSSLAGYSPVRSLSAMTDTRPFHKIPTATRVPISGTSKQRMSVPLPQNSPKILRKPSVPKLTEIKIGPVSSSTEIPPPKPGPNQTVRQIPNPSIMLQRHQSTINNISSTNGTDYVPIKFPHHPSSIMGHHRITPSACSFSTFKKSTEKCPPAIPLKGYLDISSIMATK